MKIEFEQIQEKLVGTVEDGMILVDKPAGISSFGVVACVRGAVRKGIDSTGEVKVPDHSSDGDAKKALNHSSNSDVTVRQKPRKIKVGHTGTLDPFATGLLILMIGKGTKRCQEFLKLDKWYEAELVLGVSSSTGDPEGELRMGTAEEVQRACEVAVDEIQEAAMRLTGEIWQTVPKFSAIKVEGQRAYDLARKGVEVEMPRRRVRIYTLEILGVGDISEDESGDDFGVKGVRVVRFRCHVSSGTYVRTLGEDLARELGTVGYLRSLRRTRVGEYGVEGALVFS